MVLVRQTFLGRKTYKMGNVFETRVWEWDGTNRFTESGRRKVFGEGISAIAENEAKANRLIDSYINPAKGWKYNAVRS
jgi:hypothetical protein